MERDKKALYLRAAEASDMMLLYRWVNDPIVRKSAFQSKAISLKEHKAWFHNALQNPNVQIFILMDGEEAVGQVRLTVEHEEQTIDYSVDAGKRGSGYGMKLLALMEDVCLPALPLVGKVKIGNVASCRLFEKLGYGCERKKGYDVYHKIVSTNNEHRFAGGAHLSVLLDIHEYIFALRVFDMKNSIVETSFSQVA